MEQTKYDVFISYSRKDYVDENENVIQGNEVSKIIDALKEAGILFWFDQEGIKHGEDFGAKILKYIKASKIFVYLSTSAANDSEWTRKEIACAGMYKKKIIPVRIDDSPYHDSVMFRIADLDFINYAANPKKGREDLVNSIKHYLAEEKAAAARREAEEQQRLEEQERQHRQQEELRRKQQQTDKLRAEINKIEEECTDLEKTLLQKQHDLSELNHELEIKRKHLEEQKQQMKAILYEGSVGSEDKKTAMQLSRTLDEEKYSFQWRHPIESLHAMWQSLKETRRKRHWLVNIVLWLYFTAGILMLILTTTFSYESGMFPFIVLSSLTVYSFLQLLENKRSSIGLMLISPIFLLIISLLLGNHNDFGRRVYVNGVDIGYINGILICSILPLFLTLLVLFVRKDGKSAWSHLEGKITCSLQINKYPCYYLLFCLFLFLSCFKLNNQIEQFGINESEKRQENQQRYSQIETECDSLNTTLNEIIPKLSAEACYELGNKYYDKELYPEAISWYKKSLDKYLYRNEEKLAQYKLGICYEKGYGVEPDTTEAIKWYKKAYAGDNYVSEAHEAYTRLENER